MHGGSLAWLTGTFEWSRAITDCICYNYAFSATASQNVYREKGPLGYLFDISLHVNGCLIPVKNIQNVGQFFHSGDLLKNIKPISNYNFFSGYKQYFSRVSAPLLYNLYSVPMIHYKTIVGNVISSIVFYDLHCRLFNFRKYK